MGERGQLSAPDHGSALIAEGFYLLSWHAQGKSGVLIWDEKQPVPPRGCTKTPCPRSVALFPGNFQGYPTAGAENKIPTPQPDGKFSV